MKQKPPKRTKVTKVNGGIRVQIMLSDQVYNYIAGADGDELQRVIAILSAEITHQIKELSQLGVERIIGRTSAITEAKCTCDHHQGEVHMRSESHEEERP